MSDPSRIPHPEPLSGEDYSAVELSPDNRDVLMLDQRLLPGTEHYERLTTVTEVARGIREMVVRGAPAIGIAAAYGLVLAARELDELTVPADLLRRARPTAVNLSWAVERMLGRASSTPREQLVTALADEARAIHREDVAACRRIGELGAELIPSGAQ